MISRIAFKGDVPQSQALLNLISSQKTALPAVQNEVKQEVSKPETSEKKPILETLKKDIFTKQDPNQPETVSQTLAKSLIGIGSFALMMLIMAKAFPKMLGAGMKGAMPTETPKINNIFEDLTNAQKIEDMALPKSLKDTLLKVKNAIQNPSALQKRGGKGTNTLLLYGPPGTGKTTFAKALAKEFPNAKFASLDITKLNSKYHGETGKRINAAVDAICEAAAQSPDKKIFVFIDEIDSVMMVDHGPNGKLSNDILNEFKKCFTEKLGKHDNIITIGATNLPIDVEKGTTLGGKFLDRPMLDRFEQKILVGLPTKEQILESINKHYRNCPMVEDVLKTKGDKRLEALCEFLAEKRHNVSFRTLNSIYNDTAARITDDSKKVGFDDILETVRSKKAELNISTRELDSFIESLEALAA